MHDITLSRRPRAHCAVHPERAGSTLMLEQSQFWSVGVYAKAPPKAGVPANSSHVVWR
jgi:hypothetical protein